MRILDAATVAHLATRPGIVAHQLVWITARNIATGLPEALGLWSGEQDATLTVEGQNRTYTGAGGLLTVEPLTAGVGLSVRTHRLGLSAVAPEVEDLIKAYDTRFAPIEIHRAIFDAQTRQLIGVPHRRFRGVINGVLFPTETAGAAPSAMVDCVSETRVLTRGLAVKKSDASQRARGGDRIRRYGDISGAVPVYWGEMRFDAAVPPPVAPAPVVRPSGIGRTGGGGGGRNG